MTFFYLCDINQINKAMKKILLLSILLLSLTPSFSQWTSPGDGSTFYLRDLVQNSNGCVTQAWPDGTYYIHGDLTISPNDCLVIDRDDCPIILNTLMPCDVVCEGNITIQGSFRCMEALNADAIFRTENDDCHICFDHCTAPCFIGRTFFQELSGIRLIESAVYFGGCYFQYFNTAYTSGAVNYMNCDPVFDCCYFYDNQGAAISSGANVTGSPQIFACSIENNGLSNQNQPQINLGPGADDTIRIVDNYIYGYEAFTMVGGIAVSDLLQTGSTKVLLKNNTIANNRYGYTQQGYAIDAVIENNEIYDNNIGDDPMSGGSGISIYGYSRQCKAKIRNNEIYNNYWGLTAIYYYDLDMGTADDFGYNAIYGNHHDGYGTDQEYALYVNGSDDITAIGNYWGGPDEAFAESVIYHRPDLGDFYGLVTYSPVIPQNPTAVPEISIPNSTSHIPYFTVFPNPATTTLTISVDSQIIPHFSITSLQGQILKAGYLTGETQQIDVHDLPAGLYFITIGKSTEKLLITP